MVTGQTGDSYTRGFTYMDRDGNYLTLKPAANALEYYKLKNII
jgi:hypothetical protein